MLKTFLKSAAILAAFPAIAFADGEVNVYSYRQPELVKPLFDAFTAETGITVNVAFLNKGLVEKLVAEGSRSPADVVMTVDIARLSDVVAAGVTQPVTSETLAANIPASFRDPGNQWFGLTTRARVVFAAKDRVDPSELTTYESLADPKWKDRICIRSGTHAYNLALFSGMIAHSGPEAAKTWLEGFRENLSRKPQGNDRAQVKAVWAGECDIAIGNTYYMGQMFDNPDQIAWADSVNVIFPRFEGAGTHVNLSGMAMTKAAPNRENALKLMEYLSSPAAQAIYAETNYEYPVLPGTTISERVASWGSFTPDSVNLQALAALRPDALRMVEEVQFDN